MREAVGAVLGRIGLTRSSNGCWTASSRPRTRRSWRAWASTACACRSINATSKVTREPFKWLSRGFERLATRDRRCSGRTASTRVIDLHAVPGCQNQHWHSDNATHMAAFWRHPHFMERATALWVQLARGSRATRGWRATTCSTSPPIRRAPSSVPGTSGRSPRSARSIPTTSCSWTATRTRPTSPRSASRSRTRSTPATTTRADGMAFGGPYDGDRGRLEATFLKRTAYQRRDGDADLGGRVRAGVHRRAGAGRAALRAAAGPAGAVRALRRGLVAVDLQGRRAAGARVRVADVVLHAAASASSSPGSRGSASTPGGRPTASWPSVMEPIHALIAREFPAWEPYPWNARSSTDDCVRHILFAQAMLPEYASVLPRARRRRAGRAGRLLLAGRLRAARPVVRHRAVGDVRDAR